MKHKSLGSVIGLIIISLLTSGCSLTFSEFGSAAVPVNEGRRLDLVVDQIMGTHQTTELRTMVHRSWAADAELRSWFTLVDRVSDPEQSLFLNVLIQPYESSSQQVGTRKHGFTTIRQVRASVTFELVDVRSGTIVAASSGSGSDSTSSGSPSNNRALERAINSGLRQLVRVYAGG